MTSLSSWFKSPHQYGLSAVLILFYLGAVWLAFHPNVPSEYQGYYIDQTSHCFHKDPPASLTFMGKIRFGIDRPAQSCTTLIQGWSWQEPWGTWSDGPLSEIDFIMNSDAHQFASVHFHLIGFAPLNEQRVQVFLNHQFADEWILGHEQQETKELEIAITKANEKMTLTFHFETPLALEWFGKSSNPLDQRMLTMGLLGFEWITATPKPKIEEVTK